MDLQSSNEIVNPSILDYSIPCFIWQVLAWFPHSGTLDIPLPPKYNGNDHHRPLLVTHF